MVLEWPSFEVFSNSFLTSGTKNLYLFQQVFLNQPKVVLNVQIQIIFIS